VAEDTILEIKAIKHAAELWKEGSPRRIRVALYEDGTACSVVVEKESAEELCAYCTEPGQEEAYWAWQAHLTSPEVGYKIKHIEVEK